MKNKFKHLAHLFITAFIFCSFIFPPNADLIYWSPKKLTWKDFKGKHDATSSLDAYTDYQITFSPSLNSSSDSLIINVTCAFDKNKSSVRKGKENDSLLIHEQGHFDIAEVNARIFRKKLSGLFFTLKNMQSLMDAAYKNCVTELEMEQNLYDSETDHSKNKPQQAFWTKRIANELKQNEKFSSSKLRFKIAN